ncbi:MAG: hypothetical protein O2927_06430, partial [Planctomycetota bacterium]|nr:hypothetical protein [Planctomycetota bacterium]
MSVLFHALIVALLLGVMAGTAMPNAIAREMPADAPEDDDSEVLGIDESQAETVTWIGYDEYEEHLARLSEVEQSAMSTNPTSGGGGGSGSTSAASPPP